MHRNGCVIIDKSYIYVYSAVSYQPMPCETDGRKKSMWGMSRGFGARAAPVGPQHIPRDPSHKEDGGGGGSPALRGHGGDGRSLLLPINVIDNKQKRYIPVAILAIGLKDPKGTLSPPARAFRLMGYTTLR